MQLSNWDDLRVLLAVGRHGRLTAAARVLGVDETTVARRLKRATRLQGAALFHRQGNRLEPTEAGRLLLHHAREIERHVEAAGEGIRQTRDKVAGEVRLTAVPLLANRLLAPAAGPLLAAHPELQLALIAEPRSLSLARRDADMALRLARPEGDSRAIARRIAHLEYAPYAARDRDATLPPWIGYDDSMAALPQSRWLQRRQSRDGDPPPRLRVHDGETLLQAVRAGAGKALLPCLIADKDALLERLEDGAVLLRREIWLLQHPDLRSLARFRVVADWLQDLFASDRGQSPPA